jgi:hypothetical protein
MSAFEVVIDDKMLSVPARLDEQTVTVTESAGAVAVGLVDETVLVQAESAQITVMEIIDEVVIDSEYDTCANPAPSPQALFAIAGAALDVGMPVYMSSSGSLFKAASTGLPAANVVGLATYAAQIGGMCSYTTDGQVQRSDWTAIAGTSRLSVGKIYYLSATAGMITDIPPETGVAVPIGTAVYDTTLDVEVGQAIQLM